MKENILPLRLEEQLRDLTEQLVASLDKNLYSFILYGSAVRGDFAARSSDLNLLIILYESTPQAHEIIADAVSIHADIRVDPIVLGRAGIKRNFEMSGAKFLSIGKDYRILHGSDPFKDLVIDRSILRFLAEQTLRNLRMRAVRAYVLYSRDRSQYVRFINRMRAAIFIALSDVLRLADDTEVPHDFAERPEAISQFFSTDATVLNDFLMIGGREKLSQEEVKSLHEGLFNLLNHAIYWIETHWKNEVRIES